MRQSARPWLPDGLITTTAEGNQLVRRDGRWSAFGRDQDVDHVRQELRGPGPSLPEQPAGSRRPASSPSLNSRQKAVADMTAAEAQRQGINPRLAVTMASIESTLGEHKVNPSGAIGVYQFPPGAWAEMGGGDRFDDALNINHGVGYLRENLGSLRRALGREPEHWEAHLSHQQGLNGAKALLSGGERGAIEALIAAGVKPSKARSSIEGNGGRFDMSAAEFARFVQSRYGRADQDVAIRDYWDARADKGRAADEDDHWPRC